MLNKAKRKVMARWSNLNKKGRTFAVGVAIIVIIIVVQGIF